MFILNVCIGPLVEQLPPKAAAPQGGQCTHTRQTCNLCCRELVCVSVRVSVSVATSVLFVIGVPGIEGNLALEALEALEESSLLLAEERYASYKLSIFPKLR